MGDFSTTIDQFGVGVQAWLGVGVDWFTNPGTGGVLASLIVVLGVIVFLVLVRSYWISHRRISKGLSTVTRYDGIPAFAASYAEVRKSFARIPQLKACFREFDETLIPPDPGDRDSTTILNTIRPSEFFNPEQAGGQPPLIGPV